jgi:hypothetical protein
MYLSWSRTGRTGKMGLLKSADGQSRPIEAQLARLHVATTRRHSRDSSDQVMGAQVHADLFTQHLWVFGRKHFHSHRGLEQW